MSADPAHASDTESHVSDRCLQPLAYRYALPRVWNPAGNVLFVMLNPSTATRTAQPTDRAVLFAHGIWRRRNREPLRLSRNLADLCVASRPRRSTNDATILLIPGPTRPVDYSAA
jgi:hypothetical protein